MMKSFCEKKLIIKRKKKIKKPTSEIKKKAPTQNLIDTRKEREGNEKVRTFPIPSAPKLSEISTPSREVEKETKYEENMAYSTTLLSKEGQFIEVTRKKNFKKKKDIKGNGEHDDFSAATKLVSLYVGRCNMTLTTGGLINFCEKNDIKNSAVNELNLKSSWFKSFKITIEEKYLEKLLKPEFWSKGIIVRRFFNYRKLSNMVIESNV